MPPAQDNEQELPNNFPLPAALVRCFVQNLTDSGSGIIFPMTANKTKSNETTTTEMGERSTGRLRQYQ
jgi:hypothetical protein